MLGAVLEDVRKAESDADRILDEARLKSAAIVAEAREKAAQSLKENQEELASKLAQFAERRKEKMLALREKARSEGADELRSLRKAGEKKLDDAVALVLEAFESEILR